MGARPADLKSIYGLTAKDENPRSETDVSSVWVSIGYQTFSRLACLGACRPSPDEIWIIPLTEVYVDARSLMKLAAG